MRWSGRGGEGGEGEGIGWDEMGLTELVWCAVV